MHSQMTDMWTPVALSSDLPAATAMPAHIAGETIALWRSASGKPTAVADRCPHRGMRLSHGFVRGEALSCIYHGWRYGQDGHCLAIPAHPGLTPPATIRAETYPVFEQDGMIWVGTAETTGTPPPLAGLAPLRALNIAAGRAAIEAAAGAKADADKLLRLPDGSDCCLLLSPLGADETLVYVLVPEGADATQRMAASRAAEALRRTAEAETTTGAA